MVLSVKKNTSSAVLREPADVNL